METITNPTPDLIKKAAKALKDGYLVAFPTETVYGLGADATNEKAVSRIYSAKGRPTNHPLIVHISSISLLNKWAINAPEYAIKLSKEFWPGPMTLILKRSELAKDFITGGQDNVGIRIPDQPVALALLTEFEKLGGSGVAAPSANRFGAVSPTEATAVYEEIGEFLTQKDFVLNGGQCLIGVESTIIDCTKESPRILRFGAITPIMVEESTGLQLMEINEQLLIRSPGSSQSHYSPKAIVLLDVEPESGDGFFADDSVETPPGVIRISSPRNVNQFAQQLYSALRSADALGLAKIVIHSPRGDGLAEAIRDRIRRAAFKSNIKVRKEF
jgi:L-threonylcarbamoyladenylate synthase